MNDRHIIKIAKELNLKEKQVEATAILLEDDATIPFIARYRKEVTGSLDEVEITAIRDRIEQLSELDKRREAILKSLEERELLTDDLKEKIVAAETMTELEDIYLPYKPKKRTRAIIAKEKGLEPLALLIFEQGDINFEEESAKFIDIEKGVNTPEEALAGARDIIAEMINEDKTARERMRELYVKSAVLTSALIKGKEEDGIKYKDYYEWKEPAQNAASHRLHAMFRGENELFLRLEIQPPEEDAFGLLERLFIKANNSSAEQVKMAAHDGYKRLLSSSIENEFRAMLKERADAEAIRVFSENLRQLLLAPPLGEKTVLALDPGFRTGCKVVCLNRQGMLLENDTIYPHKSESEKIQAGEKIAVLCRKHNIEVIAIGNGTAGRETETFVRNYFSKIKLALDRDIITDETERAELIAICNIPLIMVNESGASIYSASEVAREEFPDHDVTVRGSVSIGRRLMDPLSELVKIDPKSIGVGQYQHDVNQTQLRQKLDDVVSSCVNNVGVELNTASKELLKYVSGLGPRLAKSVIEFRNEKGAFKSRHELKKIPRFGDKAFEQAAGFLRIHGAENPLDESAVHPESYHIVEQMAKDVGCSIEELIKIPQNREKIDINKYITDKVGLPTLEDIRAELSKPGRDPRQKFEIFEFAKEVEKIEDLKPGMKLPGIVTNITNFGVFVDIGVHQDGLVHVSQVSDRFIKHPADVLKVHQRVNVTVLDVDVARKRINLSLKTGTSAPKGKTEKKRKEDSSVKLDKLFEKFGKKR
ncbi:MAG TPA: Tex family protein [Ignavibacteria bacterium]